MTELIKGQVLVDASYIGKTRQIYLTTQTCAIDLLRNVSRAMASFLDVIEYSHLAARIFGFMTLSESNEDMELCNYGIGCDIETGLDILITLDCESKSVFVEYPSGGGKEFTQAFSEFAKGVSPVELLDKTEEPTEPEVETGPKWLCNDCGDEFEVPRDANIPDIVCATCASINIKAM